jgi:uncharacterized membrane protein YbhN (UPF0104 family)
VQPDLLLSRRHLVTRRQLVVSALSLAGVAAVAAVVAMPQLLGDQVTSALGELLEVSPGWLWLAALSFAGGLVAAACAWRSALCHFGGELSPADASARYGVGSLANAFLPAKVGTALRLALFSRVLHSEGRLWTVGGIGAAIGAARAVWLIALLSFGAASGVLPAWPLGLLALGLVAAVAVAVFARGRAPQKRVAHLLDEFRVLGSDPRAAAKLIGWTGLAVAAKVAAAAAIAAAFGIDRPLVAALLVVPALDLAGFLPLTPGNIGVASAAVAFALHSHGAATDIAISAGVAFSAVETVTSLVFGAGSLLYLIGDVSNARRLLANAAAMVVCFGLGVAFGATVVLPLV